MRQAKVIVEAAERLILVNGARFTTQELVKEAGIATQTFYRHFTGKDQLLLAVIEDIIANQTARYEASAQHLPDPVARLRHYVRSAVSSLNAPGWEGAGARFIPAEHWRLHQLYPEELAHATRPFADLVARELTAAQEAGLLTPRHIERDATVVARLVTSVYHHYAFARTDETAESIGDYLWSFCLAALGGSPEQEQPDGPQPTDAQAETKPAGPRVKVQRADPTVLPQQAPPSARKQPLPQAAR
ncbi:TetR/AcrR family transcriptional regulator [Frankia sp. Mgl5]|uniref:TetR/AcrR family transcriptional regulator n=1 Tax=Frankia sp. Mgl5 TaxID=2933793 RepID=UPI00200FA845|nr:TetR/AcrR family transcriptional regulator [Frankia sp. Mgl5]MCK9928994.1 TetR/AcrR family transcriptional regulator [Frankia sp. Mgl5]